MVKIDPKELEKLPPEERLKKLKALEEEGKKELKEAEELIKKVEKELKIPKKEMEVPPLEPVDISRLFEKGKDLEGAVGSGASKKKEESDLKVEYQTSGDYSASDYKHLMEQPTDVDYKPGDKGLSEHRAVKDGTKFIPKYTK